MTVDGWTHVDSLAPEIRTIHDETGATQGDYPICMLYSPDAMPAPYPGTASSRDGNGGADS